MFWDVQITIKVRLWVSSRDVHIPGYSPGHLIFIFDTICIDAHLQITGSYFTNFVHKADLIEQIAFQAED